MNPRDNAAKEIPPIERKGVVLFDCFGLFANDPMVGFFQRVLHDDDLALKDSFCEEADRGNVSLDEVLAQIADYMKTDVGYVRGQTIDTVRKNPSMMELPKKLRKHHRVALLSNCMEGAMETFFGDGDFLSVFDARFLSCDIGLIKPTVEYFRYCLDRLSPIEGPVVFFDDNPHNVEGAKKAGLDAVLFLDQKQCEEELRKRGFVLI